MADIQNQSEFWLFSSHGVLYSNKDESDFISLSEWAKEYDQYQKLQTISFIKLFRLRKYFLNWRAISHVSIFGKRRKSISRNLLLTEIELAQPTLAISSLLCELESMNILPQLSNVWSIDSFRSASILCHLDMANMVENLCQLASIICSGTHTRIQNTLLQSRDNVTKLDRAPRSNSESWYLLRQNLAQAQKILSRFERAEINFEKFQKHTVLRICTALLELRRKQLIYIWNRINSEPVMVLSITTNQNNMCLCPKTEEWIEVIHIHLTDIVSIIGLALQRAQSKAEENGDSESQKMALRHGMF